MRLAPPAGVWPLALCLLLLPFAPARAQAPRTGRVRVEAPAGVEVFLDWRRAGIVGADGALVLEDVPAGPHRLRAVLPRMAPREAWVDLGPGQTYTWAVGAFTPRGAPQAHAGPEVLPPGLRAGARPGEYVNEKDGSVLVWVPPGSFRMGSLGWNANERPVHEVTFRQGFFMGKHEVTWGQFRRFCAETERDAPTPQLEVTDDHPVHGVTWGDAVAYCEWAGLRLPSEAEWEYAAAGGDGRKFPWGDERPTPDLARAGLRGTSGTLPVGSCPDGASPFGCLDMGGNVWEWVADAPSESYEGAPADGRVWEHPGEARRVFRGNGWYGLAGWCRVAYRGAAEQRVRLWDLGFRVAVDAR